MPEIFSKGLRFQNEPDIQKDRNFKWGRHTVGQKLKNGPDIQKARNFKMGQRHKRPEISKWARHTKGQKF